jgi:hypothetical protein
VQHGGKTAKLKSQCMPCLIHRHYQYVGKINTMLVHREQLKSRAMQLASRTKTVHGPNFEETSAALQYDTTLSRLQLYRGHRAPFISGHCLFSALAASSAILSDVPHITSAKIVRGLISGVYSNDNCVGLLRSFLTPDFAMRQPGFSESEPLQNLGVNLSVKNDHWVRTFLRARAAMMKNIDVS